MADLLPCLFGPLHGRVAKRSNTPVEGVVWNEDYSLKAPVDAMSLGLRVAYRIGRWSIFVPELCEGPSCGGGHHAMDCRSFIDFEAWLPQGFGDDDHIDEVTEFATPKTFGAYQAEVALCLNLVVWWSSLYASHPYGKARTPEERHQAVDERMIAEARGRAARERAILENSRLPVVRHRHL